MSNFVDDKDLADFQHDEITNAGATKDKLTAISVGQVHNLSLQERQTAWELAREADPGPKWYSPRGLKFVFCCMVCCMGSADGSFDGTLFSSIISMTQFLAFFGLPAIASAGTGIVLGIGQVGGVAAFPFQAWLPDRIGRKPPMYLGNLATIIGALLAGFAKNRSMLMGGRFLLGFAAIGASGKPYLAEITTAHTRGRWMGVSNVFWYVGNMMATGVCIPFGYMTSEWAWRVPVLMQAGLPCLQALLIIFIPESPRWLYAHGQKEKAVQVIASLHSRDNDVNSPVVQLAIQEIEDNISLDGADSRWWDFRALFNTRSARYRFWLCTIVAVWGQLSGQGAVNYFLPALLQQAGITDGNRQRILNLASSLVQFGCAFSGSMLIDHVGRRPLFIFAESVAIGGLAILGGLLSPHGHQSTLRANAGITFMFLFSGLFAFGVTAIQVLYPTEVLPFENRAKGLALQGLEMTVCGLVTQFGLPPMLGHLGYKTYFVFMGFDVLGLYCIWRWVVETKQLSLEDLDEVFASPEPKKTSLALFKDAKVMAAREREALALQA